jgi:hypothetical protein
MEMGACGGRKKRLKDERDGSGKSLERTSRGLLV